MAAVIIALNTPSTPITLQDVNLHKFTTTLQPIKPLQAAIIIKL